MCRFYHCLRRRYGSLSFIGFAADLCRRHRRLFTDIHVLLTWFELCLGLMVLWPTGGAKVTCNTRKRPIPGQVEVRVHGHLGVKHSNRVFVTLQSLWLRGTGPNAERTWYETTGEQHMQTRHDSSPRCVCGDHQVLYTLDLIKTTPKHQRHVKVHCRVESTKHSRHLEQRFHAAFKRRSEGDSRPHQWRSFKGALRNVCADDLFDH